MSKKIKRIDKKCLLGKHFVTFLRLFGAPENSVILYDDLLGYELRYWIINGREYAFFFNPNNRCVSVDFDDFVRKRMM